MRLLLRLDVCYLFFIYCYFAYFCYFFVTQILVIKEKYVPLHTVTNQ